MELFLYCGACSYYRNFMKIKDYLNRDILICKHGHTTYLHN